MVFAFAGLSTITSFFAMARDTLAAHWDTPRVAPRPSLMYLAIAGLSWPLLYGLFRLRARGREHLPGGFVLAANHNSNFDPWPLGLTLFPRRYLRFMGKSELFLIPLKQIALAAGAFPVRRGQADLRRSRPRSSSAARATSWSCSRRARGARRGCGRSTRRGRTRVRRGSALDANVRARSGRDRSAPTGSGASRSCESRTVPPIPLDDLAGREDMLQAANRAADGGDRRQLATICATAIY